MNKKSFAILTVVTAVAVIVAAVAVVERGGRTDAAAGGLAIPGLAGKVNDVAVIAIQAGETKLSIRRTADGWVVDEKHGYPADLGKVRKVVVELADLELLERKTRREDRYARLEVEDPSAKNTKSAALALKTAAGERIAELVVGKRRFGLFRSSGRGIYLRKLDDPQVWLARGDVEVGRTALEWLDRKLVRVEEEDIHRLVIRQPDGATLSAVKPTRKQKYFTVENLPEGRKLSRANAVDRISSAFDEVDLYDVRPASEVSFPEAYVQAELTTFYGLTVAMDIAEIDSKKWARLRAAAGPAPIAATTDTASTNAAANKTSAEDEAAEHKAAEDEARKTPADAAAEAAAINARAADWVYLLNDNAAAHLSTKLSDVLAPLPTKQGS